jgi:hypothetical protein
MGSNGLGVERFLPVQSSTSELTLGIAPRMIFGVKTYLDAGHQLADPEKDDPVFDQTRRFKGVEKPY